MPRDGVASHSPSDRPAGAKAAGYDRWKPVEIGWTASCAALSRLKTDFYLFEWGVSTPRGHHIVYLEHFIPVVVDHLDRNLAGLWWIEGISTFR